MSSAVSKTATISALPSPRADAWDATERWIRIGNRTVYGLLGGLLVFTSLVSISAAVVSTGTVTVESNYTTAIAQQIKDSVAAFINGLSIAEDLVVNRLYSAALLYGAAESAYCRICFWI